LSSKKYPCTKDCYLKTTEKIISLISKKCLLLTSVSTSVPFTNKAILCLRYGWMDPVAIRQHWSFFFCIFLKLQTLGMCNSSAKLYQQLMQWNIYNRKRYKHYGYFVLISTLITRSSHNVCIACDYKRGNHLWVLF